MRAAALLLGALVTVASARTLLAHDFWLVPDAFRLAPGDALTVRGQTSSRFPTSESAVALARIASAQLLGATGATELTDLSHAGKSLVLRHRPSAAGQYVVAVTLHPTSVRESAAGFRRYMELEGAPELAARYEREGRLPTDSITRRYAKYAKTVVEVGRDGPRAFARVAGHPLEFVPLRDPATMRAGDTLAVRLLHRGRPLTGAHLHAGAAPAAGATGAAAEAKDVSLVTDADGVAHVPVARAGSWNVRTLHIVPADAGAGADWDVHWATLVFPVAAAGTAGAAADSAAVADVVTRFHAALATGDSARALALLAPDAVVLESGGRESRAEYRSHHLPGDIAFARAVRSARTPLEVTVRGDAAWVVSTSTATGTYRERAVNSSGAELMVLARIDGAWRIAAIHWSSRTRR